MIKRLLLASVFAAGTTVTLAQDGDSETMDELASDEEVQMVNETLSKIGCKAPSVEKESDNLFEVDDATCEIGQYDIKLNSEYQITVMSIDE